MQSNIVRAVPTYEMDVNNRQDKGYDGKHSTGDVNRSGATL